VSAVCRHAHRNGRAPPPPLSYSFQPVVHDGMCVTLNYTRRRRTERDWNIFCADFSSFDLQ
jgi:hypothetical protein